MSNESKQTLKTWFFGLLAAIIGGGANAASSVVTASVISPQTFNLESDYNILLVLKLAGITFLSGAITGACLYLKQSPVPAEFLAILLVGCAAMNVLSGCAVTRGWDVGLQGRHESGVEVGFRFNPELRK